VQCTSIAPLKPDTVVSCLSLSFARQRPECTPSVWNGGIHVADITFPPRRMANFGCIAIRRATQDLCRSFLP
jgi:hypothetical protein